MNMSQPLQWHRDSYTIDTNRERLDFEVMAGWIRRTYWAPGRPRRVVQRSWDASAVVFGMYHGQTIVGWARVVTDFVSVAYLADVFLLPEHRGHGLGTWLVETILNHPDLQRVRWILHTADAQGLYQRFGFERMGGRVMERPRALPPELDED
jgi:GNAT superfamily N-acetyltransferase